MTHVTCRLTAKNRDQLRNPTLGNRVWATFLYNQACRKDGDRNNGVGWGCGQVLVPMQLSNVCTQETEASMDMDISMDIHV